MPASFAPVSCSDLDQVMLEMEQQSVSHRALENGAPVELAHASQDICATHVNHTCAARQRHADDANANVDAESMPLGDPADIATFHAMETAVSWWSDRKEGRARMQTPSQTVAQKVVDSVESGLRRLCRHKRRKSIAEIVFTFEGAIH